MSDVTENRSERVDLRMTPAAKRTLQQAASVKNKTLTEFLLDIGLNAAFDTLADRRVFQLDAKRWDAFMAALDKPPKDNPRLRKLMPASRSGRRDALSGSPIGHSGTLALQGVYAHLRRAMASGPGIQMPTRNSYLDSGFAGWRPRPGMTGSYA